MWWIRTLNQLTEDSLSQVISESVNEQASESVWMFQFELISLIMQWISMSMNQFERISFNESVLMNHCVNESVCQWYRESVCVRKWISIPVNQWITLSMNRSCCVFNDKLQNVENNELRFYNVILISSCR